jgi:hypothetical protein
MTARTLRYLVMVIGASPGGDVFYRIMERSGDVAESILITNDLIIGN